MLVRRGTTRGKGAQRGRPVSGTLFGIQLSSAGIVMIQTRRNWVDFGKGTHRLANAADGAGGGVLPEETREKELSLAERDMRL